MPASHVAQRLSFVFLCSGPLLAILLVAIRLLRIPVVHEVIGLAVFAMFAIAIGILGFQGFTSQQLEFRLAAIAATLLILPFVLISLFWVGLGPPWLASPAENQIRYLVLITNAAAVVGGCIALKEALSIVGEGLYSTLGFTGMILAAHYTWSERLSYSPHSRHLSALERYQKFFIRLVNFRIFCFSSAEF